MKKLLALCLVTALATSSFAYVPLSNSQTNLGSFRNGATRGMFYEEIDVLSASPVTLMDFGGTNLYTNWGNVRYSDTPTGAFNGVAQPATGAGGADRAFLYDATGRSQAFNIGLIGNPLSFLGIDNSRGGVVFQNFGSKAVTYDLDNDPGTGSGGLDSEGKWSKTTLTDLQPPVAGNDEVDTTNSNVKYYDNNTNTQWDAGIAYKGLILSDMIVGFSINNRNSSNIRTVGGSKGYAEVYTSTYGATQAGMPAAATNGDSYSVDFVNADLDINSDKVTDILVQARYPIFGLQIEGGLGLRSQTSINPNGTEPDLITLTGREGFNSGATPGVLGTQVFNTGTAIRKRSSSVDYTNTNFMTGGNVLNQIAARGGYFVGTANGTNAGIASISDERKGTGPLIRLEAMKEWSKVNLTGIFNLSTVKQNIDGSMVSREYVATSLTTVAAATPVFDSFVQTDYTKTEKFTGDTQLSQMDIGAKIEMKALEGMKLAFGGFIHNDNNKTNYTNAISIVNNVSYSNGVATDNTTNGYTPAGATATTANRPTAAANGEGTYQAALTQSDSKTEETLTTRYAIPVGAEIKLGKKWTLGVGTKYVMTKTTTNDITKTGTSHITSTQVTENTAVAASDRTRVLMQDVTPTNDEVNSTYYSESHRVQYTYGVRYDVNKSLTLACNAFLDTAANGFPIANGARATVLDVDTYRLLAIQAVFHF